VPVVVDAGVGTASDACVTMEQGVDGILMNTAIAAAQEPRGDGARDATRGRSGTRRVPRGPDAAARVAFPSSPTEGMLDKDSTPARRAALEILRAVRAGAPLGEARDGAVGALASAIAASPTSFPPVCCAAKRSSTVRSIFPTQIPASTTYCASAPTSCAA